MIVHFRQELVQPPLPEAGPLFWVPPGVLAGTSLQAQR